MLNRFSAVAVAALAWHCLAFADSAAPATAPQNQTLQNQTLQNQTLQNICGRTRQNLDGRWQRSPEDPKLYGVTIAAGSDRISDRIGFRTIETRGKDILLNGKSTFWRGVSIHDENPLIPGRLRGAGDMRMLLEPQGPDLADGQAQAVLPYAEGVLRQEAATIPTI
jgi:hypothetical protein